MQVTFRKSKIDSTAISGMPPRHGNSVSLDFVMMLLGFHCTDALDAGVEGRLYEHSYLFFSIEIRGMSSLNTQFRFMVVLRFT